MLDLKSESIRATFSPLGARLVSVFIDGVDVMAGGGTDAQFLAGDWTQSSHAEGAVHSAILAAEKVDTYLKTLKP